MRPEDIEIKACFRTKDSSRTQVLLYQNSRTSMDALDRTVGPYNWKIEYTQLNGTLYGTLSIYDDEKGEWIGKSDTGEESNIAANKGLSSDILKRCIVRWGYARELYDTPKFFIDDDGRGNRGLHVTELEYTPGTREISRIVICDARGRRVIEWDREIGEDLPAETMQEKAAPKQSNMDRLRVFFTEKQKDKTVDRQELTKFKDYYKAKMAKWKKDVDVNELWEKWNTPRQK